MTAIALDNTTQIRRKYAQVALLNPFLICMVSHMQCLKIKDLKIKDGIKVKYAVKQIDGSPVQTNRTYVKFRVY